MADATSSRWRPVRMDATLALLTFVSSITDVLSFLALSHVFTSGMTGNTALLGLALGQGQIFTASHSACETDAVARRVPLSFETKRLIGIFSVYLAGATLAGALASRHLGVLAVLPLIALFTALALEFRSRTEQSEPR